MSDAQLRQTMLAVQKKAVGDWIPRPLATPVIMPLPAHILLERKRFVFYTDTNFIEPSLIHKIVHI